MREGYRDWRIETRGKTVRVASFVWQAGETAIDATHIVTDPTAPHAICLAALKAVGVAP
jgi:hypothetical protein